MSPRMESGVMPPRSKSKVVVDLELVGLVTFESLPHGRLGGFSNQAAEHHGYWLATGTSPCFTAFSCTYLKRGHQEFSKVMWLSQN